jgi:hypothetical protein
VGVGVGVGVDFGVGIELFAKVDMSLDPDKGEGWCEDTWLWGVPGSVDWISAGIDD